MYGRKIFRPYFFIVSPRTDNSRIVSSTSFNTQTVGANLVFALIIIGFALILHSHFVRSTKQIGLCGETGYPLCEMSVKNVELSEPKASFRRLVNKHLAGRLGTSALIFFCFVFLYQDKKMKWVWAKPNTKHFIYE